jgi:gamma-glutamyltranspeptidase/glutathione hydrolase
MRDFQRPGRSAIFAQNGICATSHPIAAMSAIDILKSGGNAMDAAIAGALVLNLCEPHMTGLGGDCFALISKDGSDDIEAFNGSGRAPAAIDAEALRAQGHSTIPLDSAAAVTLPGAVEAFCQMSETWGKLGISDIVQPAIHYADLGVPVAPRVAADWARLAPKLQGAAREHYLHDGQAPKLGTLFRAPQQAAVLRQIAAHGAAGFYEGDVADDLQSSLAAMGGVHHLDDFSATRGTQTTPLRGTYQNHDLFEHPPNGQGTVAVLMLNMLKEFDVAALDPFGAERVHLEAEITKIAYDARNRLIADPTYMDVPDILTSPELAQKLAALVSMDKVNKTVAHTTQNVHKDTVYITVVDQNRMSVSLIYSIFHGFGTGLASQKYGILFQNRGAGFSLERGHPNELAPRKRPMHTIIPGILAQNGKCVMPFGVMGGQYQPCGHARVLSNMLDFGMAPQEALDAPRAFAEGDLLTLETGYDAATAQALVDKGHQVEMASEAIGGAQAIRIHENGILEGASDPRKDGCAIGY